MFNFLKRMREHADRINDYFIAATKAYIFKGDEAAGFAAFTAGATAARVQRSGMMVLLRRLAADLNSVEAHSTEPRQMAEKLRILAAQIASKDWTVADCVTAKRHLRTTARSYYEALGKADPTVFFDRYPDLQTPESPADVPMMTTLDS
jgi:hypothetical protein